MTARGSSCWASRGAATPLNAVLLGAIIALAPAPAGGVNTQVGSNTADADARANAVYDSFEDTVVVLWDTATGGFPCAIFADVGSVRAAVVPAAEIGSAGSPSFQELDSAGTCPRLVHNQLTGRFLAVWTRQAATFEIWMAELEHDGAGALAVSTPVRVNTSAADQIWPAVVFNSDLGVRGSYIVSYEDRDGTAAPVVCEVVPGDGVTPVSVQGCTAFRSGSAREQPAVVVKPGAAGVGAYLVLWETILSGNKYDVLATVVGTDRVEMLSAPMILSGTANFFRNMSRGAYRPDANGGVFLVAFRADVGGNETRIQGRLVATTGCSGEPWCAQGTQPIAISTVPGHSKTPEVVVGPGDFVVGWSLATGPYGRRVRMDGTLDVETALTLDSTAVVGLEERLGLAYHSTLGAVLAWTDGRASGTLGTEIYLDWLVPGGTGCTTHEDCGPCFKCDSICMPQANGEDLKDECAAAICADGACNGTGGCGVEPPSTVCRVATGACDAEESCDGVSPTCPSDAKLSSGTPCPDGDGCNGEETCDGSGACLPGSPVACATTEQPPRLRVEKAGGVSAGSDQLLALELLASPDEAVRVSQLVIRIIEGDTGGRDSLRIVTDVDGDGLPDAAGALAQTAVDAARVLLPVDRTLGAGGRERWLVLIDRSPHAAAARFGILALLLLLLAGLSLAPARRVRRRRLSVALPVVLALAGTTCICSRSELGGRYRIEIVPGEDVAAAGAYSDIAARVEGVAIEGGN